MIPFPDVERFQFPLDIFSIPTEKHFQVPMENCPLHLVNNSISNSGWETLPLPMGKSIHTGKIFPCTMGMHIGKHFPIPSGNFSHWKWETIPLSSANLFTFLLWNAPCSYWENFFLPTGKLIHLYCETLPIPTGKNFQFSLGNILLIIWKDIVFYYYYYSMGHSVPVAQWENSWVEAIWRMLWHLSLWQVPPPTPRHLFP